MRAKSQKHLPWLLILLVTAAFVIPATWAVPASDDNLRKVIDPEILRKLDQGESHVNIIVLLTDYKKFQGKIIADRPAQMATLQSEIQNLQNIVLNKIDPAQFKLRRRFENIPGFSGRVTQKGIQALVSMPEVELIEEDKIVTVPPVQAVPFTSLFVQPDGMEFKARQKRDEWNNWIITKDGYAIIKDEKSGYWIYAQPDSEGKPVKSLFKVGIDMPIGISKGLRPKTKNDKLIKVEEKPK